MHESRTPLLVIAAWLAFTTPSDAQNVAEVETGPLRAEIVTLSGTVEDIDHQARRVTLKGSDGSILVLTVAPAVTNLMNVNKGDRVTVKHIAPVAVSAMPSGKASASAPPSVASVVMDPGGSGEKSAHVNVETEETLATVESVDLASRTVVLRGSDGRRRTIKVDPSVRLDEVAVGDQATLRITKAFAIAVEE
jgi:hypothetical protein